MSSTSPASIRSARIARRRQQQPLRVGLVRKHRFGEQSQYEPGYPARQHDHIILDNGEVLEFCDPRIQQIKATLEDHFGIEILHHALHIYARKKG